jgi:CO/xanthine dehydrogenase Mo-binding subunit
VAPAINPALCEGQTEGGTLNGISYALTEQYLFKNGRMTNASSRLPHHVQRDVPPIRPSWFPPTRKPDLSARSSVSEICINGPAPVFGNAHLQRHRRAAERIPVHPRTRAESHQAVKRWIAAPRDRKPQRFHHREHRGRRENP